MIKINKNLSLIPLSLKPATVDFFPLPNHPHITARTTHNRRLELINDGKYTGNANYNSRYKLGDIRIGLNSIYYGKCAFCETKIEQSHVEHYRPKNIYYWLAYSWDNLLLSCATCNQNKGINFELYGVAQGFTNNLKNLRNINLLSENYDALEQPKLVNPEVTDPLGKISFDRFGVIYSENERFAYTIKICKLDRSALNLERKRLLDIFKRDINSILTEESKNSQLIKIEAIIQKFFNDAKDREEQYLAFRRFVLQENWLGDIVKELN